MAQPLHRCSAETATSMARSDPGDRFATRQGSDQVAAKCRDDKPWRLVNGKELYDIKADPDKHGMWLPITPTPSIN